MLRLPDPLDHFACALRIGGPDFRLLRLAKRLFRRQACQRRPHPADFQRVTIHLEAEFREQPFGDATDRHPDCRFPRAGLLQHVPDVAMVVLDGPDQIGMAGPRARDDFFRDRGPRLRGHDLFPVLPVPIGDMQGDGGAEGEPFADAREELDAILLDPHTAATAVAFLPPGKVVIDVVRRERQARGHPFQDGDQPLPVGFSPVQVPEHEGSVLVCYSLMSVGVTKTSSSVWVTETPSFLNSQPRKGMRLNHGTPCVESLRFSSEIPPSTVVSPFLSRISDVASFLSIVGPAVTVTAPRAFLVTLISSRTVSAWGITWGVTF